MRGPNTSSEGRIGTVCFAAIAALLAGGAVGPGPRQELPERPIPILSLPYDVPRPADGDEAPDSGPEMAPTLLSRSENQVLERVLPQARCHSSNAATASSNAIFR